jgi:hypothetical protein
MMEQNNKIQLISFDNPYPPNFGGVIDVFFKIQALHAIGYEIYLHCFVKEIPKEYTELEKITSQVFFYKIKQNPIYLFASTPFSILSRNDKMLLKNMEELKHPILYEGLKTTFSFDSASIKDIPKFLRLHNIEEDYFNGIAKSETKLTKKLLYYFEAKKFKQYKFIFEKCSGIFTLSVNDTSKMQLLNKKTKFIPVFHGNTSIPNLSEFGDYAFYHGDLTSSDNRKSVLFLISIFKEIKSKKLIISSSSNQEFVNKAIGNAKNIEFVYLKNHSHLLDLFSKAHINICWSFQQSGTKLKVINSIFNSRFCIINENSIDDPVIVNLCELVHNKEALFQKIIQLFNTPYRIGKEREKSLTKYMLDTNNALLMNEFIQKAIK